MYVSRNKQLSRVPVKKYIEIKGGLMEHLMNCHGEWVILLNALYALPVVGIWLRCKLAHKHTENE